MSCLKPIFLLGKVRFWCSKELASFCRAAIVLGCLAVSWNVQVCVSGEVRIWSDHTGTIRKKGELDHVEGAFVFIRTESGDTLKLPIAWLSDADQAILRTEGDVLRTGEEPEPEEASDHSLEIVVAEGVGLDVESARKDSYRNAVRQVVGAYVDAETIVQNDELIADRIITLSAGFVDRVEPIEGSEQRQDGLVRIRVRAFVKITKLLTALAERKIKVLQSAQKVDVTSLLAEFQTKTEQRQAQKDVLEKALRNYPQDCLLVKQVSEPKVVVEADGRQSLKVPLSLTPNAGAYRAFAKELSAALSATNRSRGVIEVDGSRFGPDQEKSQRDFYESREYKEVFTDSDSLLGVFPESMQGIIRQTCDEKGSSPDYGVGSRYFLWDGSDRYGGGFSSTYHKKWRVLRETKRDHSVVIYLSGFSDDFQRTKWSWCLVSEVERKKWFDGLTPGIACRITLLNALGDEIGGASLSLKRIGVMKEYPKLIWLVPFFFEYEYPRTWYTPELRFPISLTVNESDIRSLDRISATVERLEGE